MVSPVSVRLLSQRDGTKRLSDGEALVLQVGDGEPIAGRFCS